MKWPVFEAISACTSPAAQLSTDRKSTRLNSSHDQISYAVFCLKKKKNSVGSKKAQGIFAPNHLNILRRSFPHIADHPINTISRSPILAYATAAARQVMQSTLLR